MEICFAVEVIFSMPIKHPHKEEKDHSAYILQHFFWRRPRGGAEFFAACKGGAEKIDDPRSKTDAPPTGKK